MFISFPRAAKALLFLSNGVLSAAAPAPIVCISVRRETVSIARPSGAPDLRRPTDIATLYHADSTRTLHGFRLPIDPARAYVRFNRRRGNVPHSRFDFGATGENTE